MNSPEIRDDIHRLLRRDLIGPTSTADADLSRELLTDSPSRWYLTGFLVPDTDAPEATDEDFDEIIGANDAESGPPEDDQADASPRPRFLPASLGLTVMLPLDATEITLEADWGDYAPEPPLPPEILSPEGNEPEERPQFLWRRIPRTSSLTISIEGDNGKITPCPLPDSASTARPGGGLEIHGQWRRYDYSRPDGTRESVRVLTIFLVNRRAQIRRGYADASYTFQTTMTLRCEAGFMARRDYSDYYSTDWDDRLADLHYSDVTEYGVGRNAAAVWEDGEKVSWVRTELTPYFDVPRVAPNTKIADVEFGMVKLAEIAKRDGASLASKLSGLTEQYDTWIKTQQPDLAAHPDRRKEIATTLLENADRARLRIEDGIALLSTDETARRSFEMMNLAIERAARQREPDVKEWVWRPFQLAFILLNLRGLVDPTHDDREIADLLFFPTGGGKTEAYLGLAALAIAHRRLSAGSLTGAGVCVIMRYTLRLLTLDQLSRAAGVICALELMRVGDDYLDNDRRMLGDWPIEIGLWVGSAASPNRLIIKKDPKNRGAKNWARAYKTGKKGAPAPIKECPWCREPIGPDCFSMTGPPNAPHNLELRCQNPTCDFSGDRALPIVVVDDAIYRRLPSFIVATIDKFAALPWEGRVGAFFAHVDRADENGFYGADDTTAQAPALPGNARLAPPSLVIQDELHLISGPLGTVAALYEAAIDELCVRVVNDKRQRPKIVASTATVRRANEQVKALFDRGSSEIFPPPGLDRRDSFFAQTIPITDDDPGRRYVGIAAPGRGPKLIFLRALTSVMGAASAHDANDPDEADPYMSALCYFNALRELGGARRIVEDEVRSHLSGYGDGRRRAEPSDQIYVDRALPYIEELTSRVSTDDVAKTKKRLDETYRDSNEPIDVALATNMISVGLDITRLGLMLVQGQPKSSSEYIQSTSRVGRDAKRPGLVLALLNLHKPRDRMHYEQFAQFHATFYRAVEPTSVAPWAVRALDRALAPSIVSMVRHLEPDMTRDIAAGDLGDFSHLRTQVRNALCSRMSVDPSQTQALATRIDHILDVWQGLADKQDVDEFGYSHKAGPPRGLLQNPLEPRLEDFEDYRLFSAGRSMRDVEHVAPITVRQPNGAALKERKP